MKITKKQIALSLLLILICTLFIYFFINKKKEQTSLNKETLNKGIEVFELDSLGYKDKLYDQLLKLPKVNHKFLKGIAPFINDNMIGVNDGITSFHYYKEIKVDKYTGKVIIGLSNLNTKVGKMYLVVSNKDGKILDVAPIAEFCEEADFEIHLSTVRKSSNEFLVTSINSGVEFSPQDSNGKEIALGGYTITIHSLLKFDNNHFNINQIDSTYKLDKFEKE